MTPETETRLRQLENGLADLRARIPAMERELVALRGLCAPESSGQLFEPEDR